MRIIKAGGHSRLPFAIELVSPGLSVVFVFSSSKPLKRPSLKSKPALPRKRAFVCVVT